MPASVKMAHHLGEIELKIVATSFAVLLLSSTASFANDPVQPSIEISGASLPLLMQFGVSPNSSREEVLAKLTKPVRQFDGNADGLDRLDTDRQRQVQAAMQRAQMATTFLPYDLDADMAVSREEIDIVASTGSQGLPPSRNMQVMEQIMARDNDQDGAVTWAEFVLPISDQASLSPAGSLLDAVGSINPAWSDRFTIEDAGYLTDTIFAALDSNGNSVLDHAEFQTAMRAAQQPRPTATTPPRPSAMVPSHPSSSGDVCALPAVPSGAQAVMIGAYEGRRYASVHFGNVAEDTGYVEVTVEEGEQPLYVVLSEFSPIVFDFKGDVDRITNVVVSGHALGGVVGVDEDKVSFIQARECIPMAYDFRSVDGVKAQGTVQRLLDQEIKVGGTYGLDRIAIPSMMSSELNTNSGRERGHVVVDENAVVSATPAQTFAVLPAGEGIKQLLESGHLVPYDSGGYKIVKPFAHFPAGMNGGYSEKFVLGRGIPMPAGSPGHSCVIIEETGQSAGNTGILC